MTEQTVTVIGMACRSCQTFVSEEIGRLDGVTEVRVDLRAETVTVVSGTPVDPADLRAAVERAGYELAGPP